MDKREIPERLREFIFNHVDSAEQLEILNLLRIDRNKTWTAEMISAERRSNPVQVTGQLNYLVSIGLAEQSAISPHQASFHYHCSDENLELLITELLESYQVRRQRVLELIYSNLKKARDFSDAFAVSNSKKKTEKE